MTSIQNELMKICDLHCDLLAYLQSHPKSDAYNPASRASIGQMRKGGVALQTFAIYHETEQGSSELGEEEFQIFQSLAARYPGVFPQEICPLLAVENASVFCSESDSFAEGMARLERWAEEAAPIAYLSLTWNDENRFGGGNASKTGLKPDGLALLRWMSGRGIAIDLSHTSDALAHDLFNAIDKHSLDIRPIASHSNFRKVADVPRNLPDPIAKEIIRRNGVIGLNFLRKFLGSKGPEDFLRQVEHAEKLGGLDHLCFGADFFNDDDVPPELDPYKPFFIDGFGDASCYPHLIELFRKILTEEQIEKIASKNMLRFFKPVLKNYPRFGKLIGKTP